MKIPSCKYPKSIVFSFILHNFPPPIVIKSSVEAVSFIYFGKNQEANVYNNKYYPMSYAPYISLDKATLHGYLALI